MPPPAFFARWQVGAATVFGSGGGVKTAGGFADEDGDCVSVHGTPDIEWLAIRRACRKDLVRERQKIDYGGGPSTRMDSSWTVEL
jgi:hypothetical protein